MSQPAFPGGVARGDPDLTERQRQVFLGLLGIYSQSARPVSSESLGRLAGIRWSSASIRSTLAELEAMGLATREHASSGRWPSPSGYAFFVRTELTPAEVPGDLLSEVDERLRRSTHDVEELLGEASRLLSSLTRQLGLAVAASLDREKVANLELATLDAGRALLVLSLGGGVVRTVVLELESPLGRAELAEAAAVLRERLIGMEVSRVREALGSDPALARDTAVRIVAQAARSGWSRQPPPVLFSAGAGNIAAQPEFADSRRLEPLLRVVETGPPLSRLMVESVEGQPAVRVSVDEDQALSGCSLVSYPLPGALRLAVGVLGPMRMDYARVVALVEAVGSRVAEYL